MTTTTTLPWPNPWTDDDAITERADYYAANPTTLTGHDIPENLSGIEVSAMRYANFARERRRTQQGGVRWE